MSVSTLIIGLGNTMLSDDGAGICAAREIKKTGSFKTNVDIVEASLGGIGLLDLMAGYKKVFIVDSIKNQDVVPGKIYRLNVQDLGEITYPWGPHFLDVRTAVELGKKFGYSMPDEIVIYAVGIKENTVFSEALSHEVKEAIPSLVAQIVKEINEKQ